MCMCAVSAVVTRSFGGRDTKSASTDERLDRFQQRTTRPPANGSRAREHQAATEHRSTLIASALRSLHDLSPAGLAGLDLWCRRHAWVGCRSWHQGSRAAQASSSARTVGTWLGWRLDWRTECGEGLPNYLEAEVRRARGLDASDPSKLE